MAIIIHEIWHAGSACGDKFQLCREILDWTQKLYIFLEKLWKFVYSVLRIFLCQILPVEKWQINYVFSSKTELQVATCKGLGVFWKLLFRWKGSIYKLVSNGGRRKWRRSEFWYLGVAKSTSLPHCLLHSLPHLPSRPEWKWTGMLEKWNSGFVI